MIFNFIPNMKYNEKKLGIPTQVESTWEIEEKTALTTDKFWKKINIIIKDKDYSYLLEKTLENFSFEELQYIEKLFTKPDYIITEKIKKLIEQLKIKFPDNFIYQIYDKLIKLWIKDINNKNKIKVLFENENNNVICWKYKTCNWFWIPFYLEWNNYKTLTKINHDKIHMLHQVDVDFDEEWIYIFWQLLNQEWQRLHFWFDKYKKKYTTLKRIEWENITSILYPVKNKRWKIMYWKYKNSKWYIIPFWYSSNLEKYVSLKIEWETICDTGRRNRKNWKLISWTFLNEKWYWLPFWFEWDQWVTLKIEWEEIHNTKNRKRDEKWKIISWEFLNSDWIWQKFKLEWWKYIIKKWFIGKIKSIF
jgi:hypothetical protein